MMIPYPFLMFPILNMPNDKFFRPPLLCDLLNSLVNFNRENKVKLSQIPSEAASLVFDFTYPLSENVTKQDFETMILEKFYDRRIGFETYTLWKMKLKVKLNEIMPVYNKLFDALENWDLFNDGENYTRTINNTTGTNNTNNDIVKNSNLPQNEIQDIEDGNYMTNYTHATNTGSASGTSATTERFIKDTSNKIEIYTKFLENRNNIMSLIFKDLEPLFYGLSNFD